MSVNKVKVLLLLARLCRRFVKKGIPLFFLNFTLLNALLAKSCIEAEIRLYRVTRIIDITNSDYYYRMIKYCDPELSVVQYCQSFRSDRFVKLQETLNELQIFLEFMNQIILVLKHKELAKI